MQDSILALLHSMPIHTLKPYHWQEFYRYRQNKPYANSLQIVCKALSGCDVAEIDLKAAIDNLEPFFIEIANLLEIARLTNSVKFVNKLKAPWFYENRFKVN